MKKIIKRIIKLIIPQSLYLKIKGLLNLLEQALDISHELEKSLYGLLYELEKQKKILLLKEQSPEFLQQLAPHFIIDDDILSKMFYFNSLKADLEKNASTVFFNFFVGAPGLTFQKVLEEQLGIAKTPLYKQQIFSSILFVFPPDYRDDNISAILEQMYDPSYYPYTACLYVAWLLLRKEEEKALDILHACIERHGITDAIAEFIPVADLAYRNGISNENINTASELFQVISRNVAENVLEKYIASYGDNATIAIVGNGPHELGLGKGEEIDAHDIVVRFNNFDVSAKNAKDYGKKTNICVFGSSNPFSFDDKKADLFVSRNLYPEVFAMNNIKKCRERGISNITTLEFAPIRRAMREKYNMGWPMTGSYTLYYLKEILKKNIKRSDIYGFSIEKVDTCDYFDGSIKPDFSTCPHNMYLEQLVLQDMFKT